MMSHRILPAALLLCALSAACGELPTRNDAQAQPAGPAYDGGYTMGSGNSATQSSGYTIGSGNEVEGSGFTLGSGNEATNDGGFGMGSGNIAADDGGYGIGFGNTASVDGDSTGRSGYTMGSGN
jgi:hypothetical protein